MRLYGKNYKSETRQNECRSIIGNGFGMQKVQTLVSKHTSFFFITIAQLVEAQPYTPEGRGFDFRWYHWSFSLTQSFRPHYCPGVDLVSNRNEFQEYFLGCKGGRRVELTTLPPSCASTLSNPQGLSRPVQGLFFVLSQDKILDRGKGKLNYPQSSYFIQKW